jgi:peptidoglycan/LPS O-acetylase OafA/YrhL
MNPRHSYACLDGVRGWAALMIACSHFVAAMHPALLGAGDWRAHFAGAGWFGRSGLIVLYNPQLAVDVFLVISGFVLATSVNNRPAPLLELAVRRWLRLGLPILATTALIWPLVNFQLFFPDTAGPLAKSDWLLLCYNYNNWTRLSGYPFMTLQRLFWQSLVTVFATSEHWYNPALWMMRMEFWGSLGVFAGYCMVPARFLRRGGGLVLAFVAIGFTWQVPLLGSIVLGVALFEVRRLSGGMRFTFPPASGVAVAIALLTAAVLLGGMPYDKGDGIYNRIYMLLGPYLGAVPLLAFRVSALCIVTAVLIWPGLQRPLLTRLSQWLGRASYMVYLVHVPILCSLGAWLLLRLEPLVGYNPATLITLPLFLTATLTVAGVGARWIDEPSNRLSKMAGAAVLPAVRAARRALAPGALAQTGPAKAEH